MRRLKIPIAVLTAFAVGAAGCTKAPSDNSAGGNDGKISTQYLAQDPAAKGPAPEVPGARKGGIINVYNQTPPSADAFDPTITYYADTNEISKLIFRTPTQFQIRNGKAVLVPDLMDLGTASADQLKWTFKLKAKTKYADGSEVKIEDFAYAIKRSMDHKAYNDGPSYQKQLFKDGDKYEGPYISGDNYAGVETPDVETLIIHLAKPFPDLPYYMTFPLFSPFPKAKDTKSEYGNNPMATGPYQFDKYTPTVELTLKRNPHWDPNTDAARHQYVDGWHFKWGDEAVKTQQQVLDSSGSYANALNYANFDSSLLPSLTSGKMQQLVRGDSPCTIVWQLDSRKIPLEVRKAYAKAFPYDQIMKVSGESEYTAEPASTILPPSVQGHKKYPGVPDLTGVGKGDPAAAKKMLEAAGKLGFEVSWYYDNTKPVTQQVNQVRSDAMTQAGFTVKAIGVTSQEIRKKRADYDAPVNSGQSPSGWCSDWPTGSSWFPVLFQTHSIEDGSSWGMLSDPALDAKIDQIANLPVSESTPMWSEVDREIMEKYIAIPLYYDKMAIIAGTNIGGAIGDETMGMPSYIGMFLKS